MSVKSIVTTTIDMIEKLYKPDFGLVVHRQKFDVVSLVGRVESVNNQNIKCIYLINDGTSSKGLEVIIWKSNENIERTPNIDINSYIKVCGQIRFQNGSLMLVAFKVMPITELNELTSHILSVLSDSLILRRIKVNMISNQTVELQNESKMLKTSENFSDNSFFGMSGAQKLVMDAIRADTSMNGISTKEIVESLRSLSLETVKESLEFLMNEGHIFNTTDEDHFKHAYD